MSPLLSSLLIWKYLALESRSCWLIAPAPVPASKPRPQCCGKWCISSHSKTVLAHRLPLCTGGLRCSALPLRQTGLAALWTLCMLVIPVWAVSCQCGLSVNLSIAGGFSSKGVSKKIPTPCVLLMRTPSLVLVGCLVSFHYLNLSPIDGSRSDGRSQAFSFVFVHVQFPSRLYFSVYRATCPSSRCCSYSLGLVRLARLLPKQGLHCRSDTKIIPSLSRRGKAVPPGSSQELEHLLY